MNNNQDMPTIEFRDSTTYDDLYTLLDCARQGAHGDLLYDFHIDGNGAVAAAFHTYDGDDMVVRLYDDESWEPTGEFATVVTDLITRLVYL